MGVFLHSCFACSLIAEAYDQLPLEKYCWDSVDFYSDLSSCVFLCLTVMSISKPEIF